MKWMLWAANVQSKGLEERLVAAHAGGYRSMSVFPFDIANWREAGMTLEQIARRCGIAGVNVDIVDPFAQWLGDWPAPDGLSAQDQAFTGFTEDEVFEMAVGLRARAINLVEPYGRPVDTALGVDRFGRVCDRAAASGLRVCLEPMPFSGVRDLQAAWDIIDGAGRENGGLTFDVWHYLRAGENPSLLSTIPAAKIFTVQLADARLPAGEDLLADLYERLVPGDGDLDIAGLVGTLATMGALEEVGVEVFGPGLTSLEPAEIGRRSQRVLQGLLSS